MQGIRSWYHKNKNTIWAIIILVFVIVGIIQLFDKISHDEALKKAGINNDSGSTNSTTAIFAKEKEPVISGGTISDDIAIENKNIINTFVEYCNNQDIQSAYDLLTEECKEKCFPTMKDFFDNYYVKVFQSNKICDIQVWAENYKWCTYRVMLMDNMLATGKAEQSNTYTDYYTIVTTEEEEKKLNINKYVGRKEIDEKSITDNITIQAINKDVYIDYEIYNLEIKNNTKNTILVDSKREKNTIFLTDTNGVNYQAYMYEVDNNLLKLDGYMSKNISIKFNKVYNPNSTIKHINFMDIILDYEGYMEQIDNYNNIEKIVIYI